MSEVNWFSQCLQCLTFLLSAFVLYVHNFKIFTGYAACPRKFMKLTNLTTKLESEILLPCYFDPAYIKSIQNQHTSVVWSHINAPLDIVEIQVKSDVRYWNNRKGRIKAFSYVSGSGNFSILIRRIQESDLGLYRCELYKETNCSLQFKEINISK